MPDHVALGNLVTFHEQTNELAKGGELLLARSFALKVSDKANPDAALVVFLDPGMGAMDSFILEQPALSHFDLPSFRLRAVADDEVIAETVAPLTGVASVKALCASDPRRAVMNNDVFPATLGGEVPCRGHAWKFSGVGRELVFFRLGVGDVLGDGDRAPNDGWVILKGVS